ncbi:peptide/nickel transport system ATP-binding protein [Thermomonospora echinospora]|uniref:Peptide/nickel transport system ATP-binding protein n=1 Tax=Thermomonospora echinospora TaxID=1992 RepID=A0A1H6EA41_9ACTN|nr:ABC transporter ATP-binding protein [Thermomonospora echinospora]SEG93979.1 peptide/nickel transport system ATP-binding protein [Thermomonospora echinospora]
MNTTDTSTQDPLLRVEDLVVQYPTDAGTVHAVSGVTFDVHRGETLGIVGESGSGKSTLLRALLRLTPHTGGSVRYRDTVLTDLGEEPMRRLRPSLQMIMQDPIASLNPRRKVRDIVAEGLRIWPDRVTTSVEEQVAAGLDAVGMDIGIVGDRRPGSFSGGQCQRIAIARALALRPDVLFCDEPVSALDVSVQARVLNLVHDAKEALGLTVLFVSHDLGVVKSVSDRVMVMYLGRICEIAPVEEIYESPAHPYTNLLLSSAPGSHRPAPPDLTGETPSPLDPPSGCRFRTRCPLAQERCAAQAPPLRALPGGRGVACHFPLVTEDRDEAEAGATS